MDKFKKLIVILLFTVTVSFLFTLLFKSPTPVRSLTNSIVINEVAWAGTGASDSDEWIELFNATGSDVDLTGWSLNATDGTPAITLSGTIPAGGFFLLERTDNNTVKDILADQIYTGALGNGGESLELKNATPELVDTANSNGGGWPAGTGGPAQSMERVDPLLTDSDDNWATNNGVTINGIDANDNAILGTPKSANSSQSISPTPTEELTPVPTAIPTVEPTAVPTEEPTPIPTAEPTAIPTEEPTPIPTEEPTPIPTEVPSPTVTGEPTAVPTTEPTPSVTPIPSPQPTPQGMVLGVLGFGKNRTVCRLSFHSASFKFLRFFVPRISCTKGGDSPTPTL